MTTALHPFSRRLVQAFGIALLTIMFISRPASAGEVLVAVAANFTDVIKELTPVFESKTGNTLTVTIGSTGKLYAQIRNGAPFQVMLAADQARPKRLEEEGGAVAGSRFTYAVGRLTLWSPDPKRIGDDPVAVLTSDKTLHIALANPELAPYGIAAKETLQALGLWDTVSDKIVMGENIGQAFAMVSTGNAEMGFVALSAMLAPGNKHKGSRWDVPPEDYGAIRQDAVLLKAGENSEAAKAFLAFLQSDAALAVIERYGYGVE
ncbi:MAG: molybdate ABC transporter substrate-binding protein [Salaquimonas sp.]|jgi:molybdate transport system substrate-binding protein|nr:molybdate ABC transporter substrate-binding protein [Salaquimonas sp.]